MADYDAVGRVSKALVELLRAEIRERDALSLDREAIALTSPDDVGGGTESETRLSVYLFEIGRSDHQPGRRVTDDGKKVGSPLPLELHYLVTAYPSNTGADVTASSRDQHSVLGLAMQVLHDNSRLSGDRLGGSFDGDTELQISMDGDSDSRVARVWDTFRDVPRYPSVAYEIGPVMLDSKRERSIERVETRETRMERQRHPPVDRADGDDDFEPGPQ